MEVASLLSPLSLHTNPLLFSASSFIRSRLATNSAIIGLSIKPFIFAIFTCASCIAMINYSVKFFSSSRKSLAHALAAVQERGMLQLVYQSGDALNNLLPEQFRNCL